MSTIEDFENAPVGATASHKVTRNRAVKMNDGKQCWITPGENRYNDEEMVNWGYTLDPLEPCPASAREALDLAWELAHEVKLGQVIPAGTHFLKFSNSKLNEYVAQAHIEISPNFASVRTLEPLPNPEPDWLDAPAVLAGFDGWTRDQRVVFFPRDDHPDRWVRSDTDSTYHWNELCDVTPLYPEGPNV